MYQGIGDASIVREVGIVPGEHALIDWDIADGDLNMIQQGVTSADFVNAVSPSYAKEILTPEFGGKLVDILNDRVGRITGIINGIDYKAFPRSYDQNNWQTEKPKIKKRLMEKLNLTYTEDRPIFSFIGRVDPNQKGLDILLEAVPDIVKNGGAFVLLGSGDKIWEVKYQELCNQPELKGKVSITNKFDVELADLIYAGSDFLLIPSKYEPCGLIQIIAMWYGTVPIVHAVGGLKDTVIDHVNGLSFDEYSADALRGSLRSAMELYSSPEDMKEIINTTLIQDFSWTKSAVEYAKLYERIIKSRQ